MPGRDLTRKIWKHFNADPASLPLIGDTLMYYELPNLQRALDDFLASPDVRAELIGVVNGHLHGGIRGVLAERPTRGWNGQYRARVAAPQYTTFHLGGAANVSVVQSGIYLVQRGGAPLAISVNAFDDEDFARALHIEVVAPQRTTAEQVLEEIRRRMRQHNVYRGRVLSFQLDQTGGGLRFHELPRIERRQLILPDETLRRVERVAIDFARHADRLRAAGRHLKRGLLLYGPPGTGKTLTAMYLASALSDRTVFLLPGESLALLDRTFLLARLLQPATVIIEDVDLIAEERTQQAPGTQRLLFELLNQMDGLSEDLDVLFVLTTNRPDLLEPALAARPGRIDQAVEVPLPGEACRRRLFALYAEGLQLDVRDLDQFVRQTEGVSAAFIRELLRTAALRAAEESAEVRVTDKHLEAAIEELLVAGGPLTRRLLGATRAGL